MSHKEYFELPLNNCATCSLYDKEHYNPYNSTGNCINPRALMIGEAPGREEQRTGKAFQGKSGQRIRRGVRNNGLDDEKDCFITNCCLCRPDDNRTPKSKEIKACKENLDTILDYFKDKVEIIVPLGATAMKAVTGKAGITKHRGHLMEIQWGKVFPIFHPAFIDKNPTMEGIWLDDIKEFVNIINGVKKEHQVYNYETITTYKRFKDFVENIKDKTNIAIDLETTGFNHMVDQIIGIIFSWEEKQGVYIPLLTKFIDESPHLDGEIERYQVIVNQVRRKKKERIIKTHILYEFWANIQGTIINKLKEIVTDDRYNVAGANYKFDQIFMESHWNIKIRNFKVDVIIMDYLLDENQYHSLEYQTDRRYKDKRGYKQHFYNLLTKEKEENEEYADASLEDLAFYGCSDGDVTVRLANDLTRELRQKKKLWDLYIDLYLPMHYIYVESDKNGVMVDKEHSKKIQEKYEEDIKEKANNIYKRVGYEFNIGSYPQLGKALFEDLKIKHLGLTDSGAYKTDKETMGTLAITEKICGDVVRYRNRIKMISTYIRPIFDFAIDDRVRYSAKLTGAVTGRLAYRGKFIGIAIQTVPRIKDVRQQFIAPEGSKIAENDYSQVELRLMAWYSQDPVMMKAFAEGLDLHVIMAAHIFDLKQIRLEEEEGKFRVKGEDIEYMKALEFREYYKYDYTDAIQEWQRKLAKGVNFGVGYRGGAITLARSINEKLDPDAEQVTVELAQHCIDIFKSLYKGYEKWSLMIIRYAHKYERVISPLGRVRRVPGINGSDKKLKGDLEREAINALIQGLGHDLLELGNIRADRRMKKLGLLSQFLFSIHDATFHEVPDNEVKIMVPIMVEELERPDPRCKGLYTPTDTVISQRWKGKEFKLEDFN